MPVKKILERLHLVPTYTEVSLLLIVFGFILIISTNENVANGLFILMHDPSILIVMIAVIYGAILTIYYAFNLKKVPSEKAKKNMIRVAIMVEYMSAALLIMYHAELSSKWHYFLIVINILHASAITYMISKKMITEASILSKNAKLIEIIVGLALTFGIFVCAHYYLELAWQIIFAILVAYAVIFNDLASRIFIKDNQRIEK